MFLTHSEETFLSGEYKADDSIRLMMTAMPIPSKTIEEKQQDSFDEDSDSDDASDKKKGKSALDTDV